MAGNAFNASDTQDASTEPISTTIARWHKLFGLDHDEAVDRIMDHRNNLTRMRVSDDHWDSIGQEKCAEGYDREAYEYELEMQKKKANLPNLMPVSGEAEDGGLKYLVELDGPLDTAEKVQHAAQLAIPPQVVSGPNTRDWRTVHLCRIDGNAKASILQWAREKTAGFEPVILVDPFSFKRSDVPIEPPPGYDSESSPFLSQ